MNESALALEEDAWDAFTTYGIFCARWHGILLFPAAPYMINLDVKLLTSGLQLWLDSTDPLANGTILPNGTPIPTWYDKSGNLNNATGGVSPFYANNSIVFNGSSFLDTTLTAKPMYETIFVVFLMAAPLSGSFNMVSTNSPAGRGLRIYNNSLGYNVWGVGGYSNTSGGISRGITTLVAGTISGGPDNGVGTTFINGGKSISQSQVFTTYGEGTTRIGAGAGSEFFNGTISEVLVYNRALSTSERHRVEGYLAWKWRLHSSLPTTHTYYNSFDVVVKEIESLTNLPTFIISVNETNATETEFTINWSGGNNTTYYTYTIDGSDVVASDDQGVFLKYAIFRGLTVGTLYSVIVTAYNSAGFRESATFQAGTIPSKPLSLNETVPLVTGFTINWSGVQGATSYTYTLNGITTVPTSSTSTSATFGGLTPGTGYLVIVTAVNIYGVNSSAGFNATTRPSNLTSLNLTNGTTTSFVINWTGGLGATSFSYTLNGIATIPFSSTSNSARFTGLLPGTYYAVIITANNSIIPAANNVSDTFNATTTPSQPVSLASSNISQTGFTVSWTGGLGATSYTYTLNGSSATPSDNQGVASKYAVFTGLSQGTIYLVIVSAVNVSGSTSSASFSISTVPSTPVSLTITNVTSTGLRVNWSGGDGATSYSYQLNGQTVTASNDQGVASKYAVFTGLLPGTTYNVVVTASNSGGFAASSTIFAGVELWLDSANPLGTGVLPAEGSVLSTWYDLSPNAFNATGVNSPTYTSSGVSFSGSYYKTNYTSKPTTESIFVVFKQRTIGGLASLVDTSDNGGRCFGLVSDSGPSLANSRNFWVLTGLNPLTANVTYMAECLYNTSGVSIYLNGTISSSNSSNPGFSSGVTYIGAGNHVGFPSVNWYLDGTISEVLVFNSVLSTANRQLVEGYLAWKWGLQATLPLAHPYYNATPTWGVFTTTIPSVPVSLSQSNGSDVGFTINWTQGKGATSYSYTINGNPVTPFIDLGLTSKNATFNGLTIATSYQIVVTATNVNGSASSASFTATTKPSKPTSLSITTLSSTSFTATWSGAVATTSYTYSLNGSPATPSNDQGLSSRSATFSGLSPNTVYILFVTATNIAGSSISGGQLDPTTISGIQTWLDSTDPLNMGIPGTNGNSVVTWYDKSGKGNNMTFSGSSITYASSSVNSLDTIYANGVSQGTLSIPTNTFTANYCGFIVLRNTDSGNTPNAVFSRTSSNWPVPLDINGSGPYWCGTTVGNRTSLGTPSEFAGKQIGTSLVEILLTTYASTGGTGNFNYYVNGFPLTLTGGAVTGLNAADTTLNSIYFGGVNGTTVQMISNFCEIIMYNSNLSIGDRQNIEGYLAWKWGLQNKPLYSPSTYLFLTTNATDTGSNVQTVTNNNVVFGRNNFKNSARFNNSTSTYLSMPFPYRTGSFTISYWFNATDGGYYNPWALSNSATGTNYGINPDYVNGSQSSHMAFSGGTLSLSFSYPGGVGTWNHFALTVNPSNGSCQLYGNGVLKSSGTGSGTLNNSAYLLIGKAGDNFRAFNGAINNFAIYNSALSASQISDIYNSQVVANSLPPTHPYYSAPPESGLVFSTLPTTPSSFSLTNASPTGFTVNWAVGAGASNYTFTLNTISTVPSLLSVNSATFTGLSPGTAYSVIVTAINSKGGSVSSLPYNTGTTPSNPTSITVSNRSTTGFQINWAGGLGATSYTYSLNGSLTTPSDDQGLASKYAVFSGLTVNTSYNVFVTAINSIGSSSSSVPMTSPTSVAGLQLWLDANDPLNTGVAGTNNGALTTWFDKSGNSRNMVWTGSSITYANSSINSLNTIYVNGTTVGTVSIPTGTFSSNYCGFIVLKPVTSISTIFGRTDTNGWGIFDYLSEIFTATGVGSRTLISNNKPPVGAVFIGYPIMMDFGLTNYAATGNTGVYNEYYSGITVPLSGGSTTGLNVSDTISPNIYFGGRAGNSVTHQVNYCEILLFNTNLTTTNRQILEGYLAWKWGLQSVRPYVAQTVLLLTDDIIDTGSIPQTITNSGVSVISLVTNPSKKSSGNFPGNTYLSLPFNYGAGSFSITYWSYASSTGGMTAWSLSTTQTGASGTAGINAQHANGVQDFYLTFSGGIVNAGNWSTSATSTVWFQSVLTVNAVTGECKSYLNGVLKNTATGVGTLQNTNYLLLGKNGNNTQAFYGYLNNFAVYNYVLTQAQITTIFNSESIVNPLASSHPYYSGPPLTGISVFTLPLIPSSLNLTSVSTTGFTVNWSGTTGITSFTYTLNGVTTVPASSTLTSATFTGLSPGTAYAIIVSSVNSGGSSPSASFAGSTLPSQPNTLSSSSITGTGFTISWLAGATATSYSYTLNGSSVTPSSDSVASKTATFTGLLGGTTYAVIVTAINAFGSTASASFNVLTAPGQPTSLNATNILSSGFTVNWSGANGATSYTYTIDAVTRVPASSTSTSATFTGLLAGTSYAVIVNAVNVTGSTASSSLSVLTLPAVPFNITQTAGSFNAITVSWAGGFGATSYTYTLNGSSATPSDDQGVASKNATFSSLTTGTTYAIVVTAVNSSGSISSPPSVSNVTGQYLWIDGNDPLGSGILPANNSTLSILYDKSGNSRNLSVTSPATPATISINSVNGLANLIFANSVYRSATLTGGVFYPFDVYLVLKLNSVTAATSICSICQPSSATSFNSLDFSAASKWSNGSESSSRTSATVASSSETSTGYILIQWAFGNSNFNIYRNGSQISYTSTYTYTPPASLAFLLGLRVDNTTTGNFNGAIAEIVAYNTLQGTTNRQYIEGALAWKWGIQSSLSASHPYFSTRPPGVNLYTAPPAPTSLNQTNGSATGFTINWSGASGATSFTYTLNGVITTPASSTSSSATFTGLTIATSYAVIVTAYSGTVANTASASFTAITAPTATNSLVMSNVTSSGFTVSWSGGLTATSYTYTINGSPATPSTDNGVASNSATFSGLAPGTSFAVLVDAVNIAGTTPCANNFSTSDILGLTLWLDAADPNATGVAPALNSAVTSWKDKSITGNHYTLTNATYAYDSVSGKNAILFSGSSSIGSQTNTSLSIFNNTNKWSIITAHRGTNNGGSSVTQNIWRQFPDTGGAYWIRWYNNSIDLYVNQKLSTAVSTYDQFSGVNTVIQVSSTSVVYTFNGTAYSTTLTNSININSNSDIQIGGVNGAENLYGYMDEVIIFNTNISVSDREKIEGYLAWKWNTQAKLPVAHPYYSIAPASPLTIVTAPTPITAMASSEITNTSFKVSWSGGAGVTNYTYTLNGVTTVPGTNAGVASKFAIFTGLSPGQTYTVVVTGTVSTYTVTSSSLNVLMPPSIPVYASSSAITSSGFSASWSGGVGATSYSYTLNGSAVTPSVDNGLASQSVTFTGLSPGTVYIVVITATNASGSNTGTNRFTPASVSSLQNWYDAADPLATGSVPANGTTIATWSDKSGFARNSTATGGAAITSANDGYPFLNFAYSYYNIPQMTWAFSQYFTLFMVETTAAFPGSGMYYIGSSSYSGVSQGMSFLAANSTNIYYGIRQDNMAFYNPALALQPAVPRLWSLIFTNSPNTYTFAIYLNGVLVATKNAASFLTGMGISQIGTALGAGSAGYYNGKMREILAFQGNMTTADRQSIEGHLAWKWGQQSYLAVSHPYYTSSPQSITTPPSAITDLSLSEGTSTSFKISWSGGVGVTSYTYTLNGVTTVPSTNAGVASKFAIFTGLSGGTSYTVIVTGTFSGYTVTSSSFSALTLPTAPTSLTATAVTSTGFTLSWSGATGATSYTYLINGSLLTPSVDNSAASKSVTFTGLTPATVYSVVINAINVSGSVSSVSTSGVSSLSGGNVVQNWYDSSDPLNTGIAPANGATVATWFDKSGKANNLSTAAGTGTFASNSLNGRGTMSFNGSTFYRAVTGNAPYPANVFIIVKLSALNRAHDVCALSISTGDNFNSLTLGEHTAGRWHNGSSGFSRTPATVASSAETSTDFLLMNWSIADSNFYIMRNGVQISQTSSYTWAVPANLFFQIGARSNASTGNNMSGSVAEVLAYNNTMSTQDRQLVEGYLAWKWGLQASLPVSHPHYIGAPILPLAANAPALNLQLWLDGADPAGTGVKPSSGATVSTWADKSGNGYNTNSVVGTPTYSPTSGIVLNGSSSYTLPNGSIPFGNSSYTIYSVVNISSFNGAGWFGAGANGANQTICMRIESGAIRTYWYQNDILTNSNPVTAGATFLFVTQYQSGGQRTTFTSGTSSSTADTPGTRSQPNTGNLIGKTSDGSPMTGSISEILVYNVNHTTTQRQQVESYLSWKWGIQANLPVAHPNYSVPYAVQSIVTAPGAITALASSEATISSFKVSWSGGTGATSYTYTLNGVTTVPSTNSGVASKFAIFTGLTGGTTYTVIVTATGSGVSTSSSSLSVATLPTVPTSLTSSAVTSTGFTVSWTGGVGATSYTYTINGSTVTPSVDNGMTTKTATFTGLTGGTTYDVNVNAVNASGTTVGGSIFNALLSSGLQLWFDAKDPLGTGVLPAANSVLTTWVDKSGNGYNATAVNSPTYTAAGITFNGSNQYFTTNYTSMSTAESIFVVYSLTNAGQSALLSTSAAGGRDFQSYASQGPSLARSGQAWVLNGAYSITTGQMYIAEALYNSSGISILVTGNPSASNTTNPAFTAGTTWIGTTYNGFSLNGTISEVIVYNSVLSTTNRQLVEGYLAWKWGIQANLPVGHPYSSASPAISLSNINTGILRTWFDASDPLATGSVPANGTAITTWFDKSGYGYNGAVTGSVTLNTNVLNSLPAAFFNAMSVYTTSSIPANTFLDGFSYFAVYKSTATLSYNTLVNRTMNSSGYAFDLYNTYREPPNSAGGGAQAFYSTYNVYNTSNSIYYSGMSPIAGTFKEFSNGTSTGTYALTTWTPTDTGTELYVGTRYDKGLGFVGNMHEVLVFNIDLPIFDRQRVEGYLAWKWGLQASLPVSHPYYVSAPVSPIKLSTAPSAITALASSEGTATSFKVSWSGGNGATSYTYTINGVTTVPATNSGVASKFAIFTGLTGGTTYTVVVTAILAGNSTASSPLSASTAPTAPNTLTASAVTNTGFTVSWLGGATATSYTYALNGVTTTPSTDNGVASKSATFSGLRAGTVYNVFVTAVNASGSTTGGNQLSASSIQSGLQLWLDASDPLGTGVVPSNGSTVSTWVDKSGNGYNAVARGSPTITTGVQNSLPGITVNNPVNTVYYSSPIAPGTFIDGLSVFIVYKSLGTNNTNNTIFFRSSTVTGGNVSNPFSLEYGSIIVGPNNAVQYTPGKAIYNTSTSVLFASMNQTNGTVSQTSNGLVQTTTVSVGSPPWTPSDTGNVITIGGRPDTGNNSNAMYHEVIVFNTNLSTFDRQNVEGYLAWKWGLQAELPVAHPYYSATSQVILPRTTTLQNWYDSSDPLGTGSVPANGTTITTWSDKSGNARNTSSALGTAVTINNDGLPYLNFNGGYFSIPEMTWMYKNYFTFFVVETVASVAGAYQMILGPATYSGASTNFDIMYNGNTNLWWGSFGSTMATYTTTFAQNTTRVWSFTFTLPTTLTIYLNGLQVGSIVNNGTLLTSSAFTFIGNWGINGVSNIYKGRMREIVGYQGAMGTSDRQITEGYLAWKWGLQASLPVSHPYFSRAPVSPLAIVTAPPAITGLGFSEATETSFKVSWSGGTGATSYTYTLNGVTTVPSTNSGVASKFAIFTGLTGGTSYTVIVNAVLGGASTPSSSLAASTAPSAPNTLTSSAVTTTGFTVSWLGGAGATSYTYALNGVTTTPSVNNGVASKTATFTGLANGTTYNISITAINAAGSTASKIIPSAVSGLQLWLDGADPNATGVAPALNSAITSWKDKTANGNHYNLSNATFSYDSVYNRNGILFSGTTSGGQQANAALSPFNNTYKWTIFTLHRGTNSAGAVQTLWRRMPSATSTWVRFQGGASLAFNNSGLTASGYTYDTFSGMWSLVSTGSTAMYSFNGTASTPSVLSDTSMSSSARITIASSDVNAEPLAGYLDEILVYNVDLSASDRQRIEGYLAWKWNLTSKLPVAHPYYSVEAPVLIVDTLPDFTYQILATGTPTSGTTPLYASYDNGQTWKSISNTIPNTSYTFTGAKAIGWNGMHFVGGFLKGSNYTIAYSTDGINWTDSGYNTLTDFKDVAYNNRWIAASQGPITVSTTGDSPTGWVTGGLINVIDNSVSNVIWAGTKWIAMGSGGGNKRMLSSNDGTTWTVYESSLANDSTSMTFANNTLLVCFSGSPILRYSTNNGTSFTNSTSAAAVFTTRMNCVEWNGTLWVGVGTGTNTLGWSNDGITWTGLGTSIFSTSGNTVAWTGARWIAGGSGTNSLAYSTDGKVWTGIGTTVFSSTGFLCSRVISAPTPLVQLTASTYSGTGTWLDSSPNARNATLFEGVVAKNTAGNGIVLNGSTSWTFPNVAAGNAWTVSVWYKNTGAAGNGSNIVTQKQVGASSVNLALQPSAVLSYNVSWYYGTAFTLTNNAWTNIQVTWNGSNMITYKDSVLVGTTPLSFTSADGGNEYYIGRKWDNFSYVTGEIGEVRIYNTPLSSSQVLSLYNITVPTYVKQPLVQLTASTYSGTGTWFDSSLNGRNATLETGSISKNAVGNGIVLNGSSSWTFPNVAAGNAWTFSVWYKNTAAPSSGNPTIVTQRFNSAPMNAILGYYSNSSFDNRFYTGGWFIGSTYTLTNGSWTNIQATWNGTNLSTYINGTLLTTVTPGGTATDSGQLYRIGGDIGNPGPGAFLRGEIGEVRIYGAALTSGEVTSLYNATASTYTT